MGLAARVARREAPYVMAILCMLAAFVARLAEEPPETRAVPVAEEPTDDPAEPSRNPFLMDFEKVEELCTNNPEAAIILSVLALLVMAALVLGGGVLLVWLALRYSSGDPLKSGEPWVERQWGAWDIIKTISMYFFLCVASASALKLSAEIQSLKGWFSGLSVTQQSLLIQLPACILVCALIPYIIRFEKGQNLRELGFVPSGRPMGLGLLGYLAILPPVFVAALINVGAVRAFGLDAQAHPISEEFFGTDSGWSLAGMVLFACLLAPLWEEMFFRGMLYPVVRRHVGVTAGILLTALGFAALHANVSQLAPIFVLGALLAYLYEKTHSLWSSIVAHAMFNTGSMAALLTARYALS